MVEVGDRAATRREATAEGFIAMRPEVLALVLEGRAAKGDVLAVANAEPDSRRPRRREARQSKPSVSGNSDFDQPIEESHTYSVSTFVVLLSTFEYANSVIPGANRE